MVHARHGIAYRHGAKGVAMIPLANGQEAALFRFALGVPVLNGHLNCHFNSHGTAIGKKHLLQGLWGNGDEFFRKLMMT